MDDGRAKLRRYREHAKRLRSIAEDVRGDGPRLELIAAAKEFEKLAAALDPAPRKSR